MRLSLVWRLSLFWHSSFTTREENSALCYDKREPDHDMFHLLKAIIWITGAVVIALFALRYFGYELNRSYWDEQRTECVEMLNDCRDTLIKKGTDGAKEGCQWNCIDLKKLLLKTEESGDASE